MGRHSLDPAPDRTDPRPATREPAAPVTDPVLLDAVQRELRRLRVEATAVSMPTDPRATRRVETPFSGPVDVPEENVIGPHRPRPIAAPHPVDSPSSSLSIPSLSAAAAPRSSSPPASSAQEPTRVAAPRPVPARPAAATQTAMSTGPVLVPTHRPAPVPVEAPAASEAEGAQEPIGLSLRTLLLSAGVGLLASTALSLLALLPR